MRRYHKTMEHSEIWSQTEEQSADISYTSAATQHFSLSQHWSVACWFPAAGLWVTGSAAGAPEVPHRNTSSCFTWKQKQKLKSVYCSEQRPSSFFWRLIIFREATVRRRGIARFFHFCSLWSLKLGGALMSLFDFSCFLQPPTKNWQVFAKKKEKK